MQPDPILERLSRLHPKTIDLSLDRLLGLLATLGNPQVRLPPVIHIAGTNGKGSTVAMLRAIHEAAGRRPHVYTSPHLVRFTERIVVAGSEIAPDHLSDLLITCEQANNGRPITMFEITTAAALLAFAQDKADLTLLEVGLGGRFDATNVIPAPALSVITPVSLDHQHFLGNTVEAIAFEKAGILKPGVPAVIGRQRASAMQVITDRAAELSAPIAAFGRDWHIHGDGEEMVFEAGRITRRLKRPALSGDHQIDNAGLALTAAELLQQRFPVAASDLETGMAAVRWPARLQRLTHGPMLEDLPASVEIWVDGGHNADAAEAIAATVGRWLPDNPGLSVHLIFGTLTSRNPADYLRPFRGLVESVHTVAISGEANTVDPRDAAAAGCALGLAASPASSVRDAVAAICADAADRQRILICGSLYLAGTVLRSHG